METQKTDVTPAFAGSKKEQELASKLFRVFQARAAFFSDTAPIRISLSHIAEFLEATEGKGNWAADADAALSASPEVFTREESDGEVKFVTTRRGQAWVEVAPPSEDMNDLKARFTTPEPRREPPKPRRTTAAGEVEDGVEPDAAPDESTFAPDSWQAAVAAALRDAQAREQGDFPPADSVPEEILHDVESDVVEAEAPVVAPEEIEPDLDEEPVVEQPTEAIDISAATDEELADAIRSSLSHEPDVARWGDMWMHESKVAKLSRGDLRRAQEYIDENGEPMGDVELVQDLRSVNPGSPDFPLERFTVNFRLSREGRDFEYLGTSTEGLWATANMSGIASEKRKASELGQDYRFLLDYTTAPDDLEEGIIEHVLTFYEYHYGVLPLNASMASLMPKAAFVDQRAARLTMESPQTGETFPVELRFPTSNRGGYVVGLEEFFESNLVPGAVLTIEATDSASHFIIEYFQMSGQDRRLLHLDERKNRFVFKPTTFYCGLQDDMLIDENRFPRLADVEPLDDRERRRAELVIMKTFERVGDNVGSASEPRYSANIIDLLAAANIERPISLEYLRDILTGGAYPEFTVNDDEEDSFFYQP